MIRQVGICLATALWQAACAGPRVETGLSNAPSLNQPHPESETGRDVIANGRDSCQPPDGKGSDPLPYRVDPCEEKPPAKKKPALSSSPRPPR